ncbi:MAG TPA: hypothetical protein VMR52_03485 [Dehalococcoidia bacterium]|nr:hypothetical protein [Dehalococcoidia bacterium]
MTEFKVGTSGWHYDDWRGRFYPEKLPKRLWFTHYAEEFDTVSVLSAFREEFVDHVTGRCERRHDLKLPKMTDYNEGEGFTYDEQYARKQPDWSYRSA